MSAEIEYCNNCSRVIGTLEQAYIYKDKIVCQQCNNILRNPLKQTSQQPVYVTQTKSTSGFGIAALVLGTIACLTCWIPFLGVCALPLAAIGALLGIIGIISSIASRRSYVGLSAAGTIVSAAAAIIFILVTKVTTDIVATGLDTIGDVVGMTTEDTNANENDVSNKSYTIHSQPVEGTPIKGSSTESTDKKSDETNEKTKEIANKQAYINNVKIINLHVGKTILDDWGVFGEIKNTGNRTLSEVEITVYYLDEYGKAIYENTLHPVYNSSWSSDNKPLKPNYSKKFGYNTDDVPSNWTKEISVCVTNLEFAK